LGAAHTALSLARVPATLSSLHSEHATLFRVYIKLRHQDVANQAAVLAAVIAQAITAVSALNVTVQAIPQPSPLPENILTLPDIQAVVEHALASVTAAAIA
jgi:hypothetical protein